MLRFSSHKGSLYTEVTVQWTSQLKYEKQNKRNKGETRAYSLVDLFN